ncbi:MAG: two-component system response regulator RegA [Hyphomicrobiaceae bacterium]|jgi:two-component system response regulator RegA
MQQVLIVEDDTVFSNVLARSLNRHGFAVESADSLTEARHKLRQLLPDAVLLDLNLGKENGLDLIPLIQDVNKAARIVVLTSYANPRAAVWAVQRGVSDYLSKPINVEEIVSAIRGATVTWDAATTTFLSPDQVRDLHILQFFEKNNRNVSLTARELGMHRRTLQRILQRLRPATASQKAMRFGRAKSLVKMWTRSLVRQQSS